MKFGGGGEGVKFSGWGGGHFAFVGHNCVSIP